MNRIYTRLYCLCMVATMAASPGESQETQINRSDVPIDYTAAKSDFDAAVRGSTNVNRQTRAIAQTELETTQLPVLLIETPQTRAPSNFFSQGTSYSAVYALPNATLLISGSSSSITALAGSKLLDRMGSDFEISEDGSDLFVQRYGIAYNLRLMCDSPQIDTRCLEEEYLRKVSEGLLIVWPGESK